MKIPILWRIERFMEKRKEEKQEERDPKVWGKHRRSYGTCPNCGNQKFITRKNHQKCTRCGFKKPVPRD